MSLVTVNTKNTNKQIMFFDLVIKNRGSTTDSPYAYEGWEVPKNQEEASLKRPGS